MSSGYEFKVKNPRSLSIGELVERLAAIIWYYRGREVLASAHAGTKEVWGALDALLRVHEKKWGEWIPLIVKRYTPDFPSASDEKYFGQLLQALLERFTEEMRGASPYLKGLMARIIRRALEKALKDPFPQVCFFVKEFHPDRVCDDRFRAQCMEVLGDECQ